VDEIPGWTATDAHLTRALGGAEPVTHWRVGVPWSAGGPDPLDSVTVYDGGDHWHYVGLGLSELGPKVSPNPALSGWGTELTFRLARAAAEDAPPPWPLKNLNHLARYVWKSRNRLLPGDFMDLNGSITATAPGSAIVAALFAQDPVLGVLDGPNGRVEFVQLVGVTADELEAAASWDTHALLGVLAKASPRLVTDLSRPSVIATRPDLADEIRAGTARDGSSHAASFGKQVAIHAAPRGGAILEVGAISIPDLVRGLALRVPYGRDFALHGPGGVAIRLAPAAASAWAAERATLELTAADARALAAAVPQRRGDHGAGIVDGVVVRVVPTEIRGSRDELVRVLG
jgi:suppressor of fused